MKCVNCLHAKVYIAKMSGDRKEKAHYVRCKKWHWRGRMPIYSERIRRETDCLDFESMGEEDKFILSLPQTHAEYKMLYGEPY